jgi:hypothetical protein
MEVGREQIEPIMQNHKCVYEGSTEILEIMEELLAPK